MDSHVATIIGQTMKLGNAMFAWIQNYFAFPLGHCAYVGMGGGGNGSMKVMM